MSEEFEKKYNEYLARFGDKKAKYDKSGIYGIYLDDHLVYIGKAVNMLNRIINHMIHIDEQDRPQTNKYVQLHLALDEGHRIRFDVLEETDDIDYREAVWIRQQRPPFNIQIPKLDNPKKFWYNRIAKKITWQEAIGENYESEGRKVG